MINSNGSLHIPIDVTNDLTSSTYLEGRLNLAHSLKFPVPDHTAVLLWKVSDGIELHMEHVDHETKPVQF